MITDAFTKISADQVLTLNATSALSDNSIDLSQAKDIGEGEEMFMLFTITELVASAATSVTFEIITATDAALTGTVTSRSSTGAIAYGSLTAGTNIAVRIPPLLGSTGQRYLGARYTTAGNNSAGTGKVTTQIVKDLQDGKKYYSSGFTVA